MPAIEASRGRRALSAFTPESTTSGARPCVIAVARARRGVPVGGSRWGRSADTVGLSAALNTLSAARGPVSFIAMRLSVEN